MMCPFPSQLPICDCRCWFLWFLLSSYLWLLLYLVSLESGQVYFSSWPCVYWLEFGGNNSHTWETFLLNHSAIISLNHVGKFSSNHSATISRNHIGVHKLYFEVRSSVNCITSFFFFKFTFNVMKNHIWLEWVKRVCEIFWLQYILAQPTHVISN